MNKNLKEIITGEGIGALKFGMFRKDVKGILGKPDDIDNSEEEEELEEESASEIWHYDNLELTALFDEALEWRLVSIAVSSEHYTLNNESIVGMSLSVLEQKLDEMELGKLYLEDDHEYDQEVKLYGIENSGIYLWVENNVVQELQFSPLMDEDDIIIWPAG